MADTSLSRRAAIALVSAFGVVAATGARATPLDNLCREVPLPPADVPTPRGFELLNRMAWAGSLITTMQEGVDPELEADLHDMARMGYFEITRRRNPPRAVSGSSITINGRPLPGSYTLEMDDGWTLSVKTTARGKVHGMWANLPSDQAQAFADQGHAAIERYGFDTPETPRTYRYPTSESPAAYVSVEEADRFFWRLDSIDTVREPWLLMSEGMVRPRSVTPAGVITWEQTDYGAMLTRLAGGHVDRHHTFEGTPA